MKLKGGGAVDPDSGHEHDCHIYKGDVLYNATLGLVDLTRGFNSYYKLQMLEHDSKSRYSDIIVFTCTISNSVTLIGEYVTRKYLIIIFYIVVVM